ncbi:MAG: YncE family protein, partial [Thermoplasmata archaeon]
MAGPASGLVYVLDAGTDNVTEIQGTTVQGYLPVGGDPDGAAWDPASGLLYVTNCGTDNVTLLNATASVGSVPTDYCPAGPAYDPSNGWVYVPNEGDTVATVINGTTAHRVSGLDFDPSQAIVDPTNGEVYLINTFGGTGDFAILAGTTLLASSQEGSSTGGLAFDPQSGWAFLIDPSGDRLFILNGTELQANFSSLPSPDAVAYDPGSGQVYVTMATTSHVPGRTYAYAGTDSRGYISGPEDPVGIVADPIDRLMYVVNGGPDSVSVLSTALEITPLEVRSAGAPVDSAEPGGWAHFGATLAEIGSGRGSATVAVVSAGGGLVCPSLSGGGRSLAVLDLEVNCTASAAGNFTLWLNVTDSTGATVWSEVPFQVFTLPQALAPALAPGPGVGLVGALLNRTVTFREVVDGGTGMIVNFTWFGLPVPECVGLYESAPTCIFLAAGIFDVSVRLVDSEGGTSTSPTATITAYQALVAGGLTANRSGADVGDPVSFQASVSGGDGAVAYAWSGVPVSDCPGPTAPVLLC